MKKTLARCLAIGGGAWFLVTPGIAYAQQLPAPEPFSLLLFGSGLIGLAVFGRSVKK